MTTPPALGELQGSDEMSALFAPRHVRFETLYSAAIHHKFWFAIIANAHFIKERFLLYFLRSFQFSLGFKEKNRVETPLKCLLNCELLLNLISTSAVSLSLFSSNNFNDFLIGKS